MTTNVPSFQITDSGPVAPLESDILAGVLADQSAAFGGDLNPGLSTPQGQLAMSQAAAIGDCNDQLLALFNGVDPAYSSGRMQDAIGRIYYMTRHPAQSTVVTCTCTGLAGVIIPAGAQARAQDGALYRSLAAATIPAGGSISVQFAAVQTGPTACPAGYLNYIYQAIPGWDTISNPSAGAPGNDAESRSDFEQRRASSVAANAQGSEQSVLGAVLAVPGVLDAQVQVNPLGIPSGAVFTGSIAGSLLTVTQVFTGRLRVGQIVSGSGIKPSTVITEAGSTAGLEGLYSINQPQESAPVTMGAAQGGLSLAPHSILISAYGGDPQAIAAAIWRKKSPGCNYNGNTTVQIQDAANYSPPYPVYDITFEVPAPTPVQFLIKMQRNPQVPSNATALVQSAVIAAFTGADGGQRARIGGWVLASRFYAGIAALGAWAQTYLIQVGILTADQNSVVLRLDQMPTVGAENIQVVFV